MWLWIVVTLPLGYTKQTAQLPGEISLPCPLDLGVGVCGGGRGLQGLCEVRAGTRNHAWASQGQHGAGNMAQTEQKGTDESEKQQREHQSQRRRRRKEVVLHVAWGLEGPQYWTCCPHVNPASYSPHTSPQLHWQGDTSIPCASSTNPIRSLLCFCSHPGKTTLLTLLPGALRKYMASPVGLLLQKTYKLYWM